MITNSFYNSWTSSWSPLINWRFGSRRLGRKTSKSLDPSLCVMKRTTPRPAKHQQTASWPRVCQMGPSLIGLFRTAGHDTLHERCRWPNVTLQQLHFSSTVSRRVNKEFKRSHHREFSFLSILLYLFTLMRTEADDMLSAFNSCLSSRYGTKLPRCLTQFSGF